MEIWIPETKDNEPYWVKKKIEPFPPPDGKNLWGIIQEHIRPNSGRAIWYLVFSKEEEKIISGMAKPFLKESMVRAYTFLSVVTHLCQNAHPEYIMEEMGVPFSSDKETNLLAIIFCNNNYNSNY